eukprot:166963_1
MMEHFKRIVRNGQKKKYIATISNSQRTVKLKDKNLTSCYGAIVIPSIGDSIHRWKFRVDKLGNMAIGIDEAPGASKEGWFINQNDTKNYAWGNWGKKCSQGTQKVYGTMYGTGDIIEMILNLSDGTLSYSKNEQIQGVAF